MTERMIANRLKKLEALESQIADLQEKADAIKEELKEHMEAVKCEKLQSGEKVIRWKWIFSNKFDTKALKAAMPEVYEKYNRLNMYRRFTIA